MGNTALLGLPFPEETQTADPPRDIKALATLPNTYMKIGGLGMRFAGFDFHTRPMPPSSDDLVAAWGV